MDTIPEEVQTPAEQQEVTQPPALQAEPQSKEVPDFSIDGAPTIMICGPQGAGKTRLASTLPGNFCLDTEGGAGSAFKAEYRKAFPFSSTMYEDMVKFVKSVAANTKLENRMRVGSNLSISALTIDTFDTVQKVLVSKFLSQKSRPTWIKPDQVWAPTMEQRDWGTVLNYQSPLIIELKALGIPIIFVCHDKITPPIYVGYGDSIKVKQYGSRDTDISGSIQNWIMNLTDYALMMDVEEDGKRFVYTQPTIADDYRILAAKDRHDVFKKMGILKFPLRVKEDGFPETKVLEYITKKHNY